MSVSFALLFMIAAERFALLSKAKETLANPESRSKYDKWRRSGIAMSYEDWCGLRGAVHTVSEPVTVSTDLEMIMKTCWVNIQLFIG